MATKKKAAGWLAMCVVAVGSFEGLRTVAYRDPVGIPTICFGETKGVKMGDKSTVDDCKALLAERLLEFSEGVERCIHVPMSDSRKAAMVSFAYNVGTGAFCKSTLVKRINAGDPNACDDLRKWTTAKGITLPGLVKRREEERKMCLS